jgi:transcriptional regulator with XRE-family HTH domain
LKTLRSRGHRALLSVLIDARRKAGLTQQALGEALKHPQSYVGKVETGERGIDPVECAAWARACGMTPREFFVRFAQALERKV